MDAGPADGYFADMLECAFDAIISKDVSGVVQSWNSAATRLFGWTHREMVGNSIRRLIPEDRQHEEDSILARVRAGEIVPKFETVRQHKDGRLIPLAVTISPIRREGGEIVGASKIAHELSDELRARAAHDANVERFRTLADNIAQFAWMADPSGHIFWYNKRWFDYTGTSLPEMEGWGWTAVHHPDHLERVVTRITHSWETGTPWEDTFPLRGADGQYRWFLSRALPIRDEAGNVKLWFGTNTDVTDERAREQRIAFLLDEMNHRSKNLLTMVQALARRTLGGEQATSLDMFDRRIVAVGANLDLLTRRKWVGATMYEIVESQLPYFHDMIGRRIHLVGDHEFFMSPAAAEAIGLAVHELATNAGKYGALSDEKGELTITWKVSSEDRRFHLGWKERGGPPVQAPDRAGFGTIVTTRNPKAVLAADVRLDFPPTGVEWQLSAPLERVAAIGPIDQS